jgi:uncharacterized protein (TIGR00299 family) protein
LRSLHFDCFSGISGDMTLAALIDAGVDVELIRRVLASLGLPITLELESIKRNGFAAKFVDIVAPDQEDYRFMADIEAILAKGELTPGARDLALRIFRKLAEAEAAAHGMPLERVHFHEVGALDSIADIVGAAVALDSLKLERVTCRSVPPGSGQVKCAHGLMPVPTPATALLLKGMPLASAPVTGELVTPTGAAILATIVNEFTDQPEMTIQSVGYGAGKKDFAEHPNLLRVFLGESVGKAGDTDTIAVLETNLDDLSPEIVGYCMERLFLEGALDVFIVPIQMKKNRPGMLLTVLANRDLVPRLQEIIFRETGTFGIREHLTKRSKLHREAITIDTQWGPIKAKKGWRGELELLTPEFEDCARVAREKGIALREVYDAVRQK